MPVNNATASRILFVTLSNIGDVVLTLPVLSLLHENYPGAAIDIIADRRSAGLFEHCPYRGDIYCKEKQKFLRGSVDLFLQLRKRRYDLVVDLRTDIIPCLVRAQQRRSRCHGRPLTHAVARHASVVAGLVATDTIPQPHVWLSQRERDRADTLLAHRGQQRLLAVGPGANWSGKIWPWQRFAEMCNRLAPRFDTVVILGNDRDNSQAVPVQKACRLPVLNLCGKTAILEAAAVLERCILFVGNDSGLGHLASAVDIDTFTLFGPGQPRRYHPWGRRAGWYADPNGDIGAIDVECMLGELDKHLQSNAVQTGTAP